MGMWCGHRTLEDTTGSWELYGQEDEKRYPSLQAEFFNRAAAPLTRRESLLAFTFVGEQQRVTHDTAACKTRQTHS